jgi:Skp family chaperone for outer membrane proteins
MLRRISVAALCGLLVTFTGCGKTSPEPTTSKADKAVEKPVGGVGVVDLDKVAKVIGRDIEMSQKVDEHVASLNNQLTTLQGALRRQYEEKREKIGDDPTDEQLKELQSSESLMERQLLEKKRKAEGELNVFRQKLVDQFREQAKPVLRDVAAARGLSIVIPKNDGLLLSIDPACEITDEVAARMTPAANSDRPDAEAAKPRRAEAETSAR